MGTHRLWVQLASLLQSIPILVGTPYALMKKTRITLHPTNIERFETEIYRHCEPKRKASMYSPLQGFKLFSL